MVSKRRDFIKGVGAASLLAAMPGLPSCKPSGPTQSTGPGRMELSFRPFDLQMRHTLTVAGNSRNTISQEYPTVVRAEVFRTEKVGSGCWE